MAERFAGDRKSFQAAVDQLQAGDCLRVKNISSVAGSAREMLFAMSRMSEQGVDFISEEDEIDTREDSAGLLFSFSSVLAELERDNLRKKQHDGIEEAREKGMYKGRKPIAVDAELFDSVVELWQSGQISARQAMAKLNLKPNTFYRRIKQREENKMKDYKKIEHEIKAEIKEAARQGRKDLDQLKKQVREEVKEVKKNADEQLEIHDVEREMRRERRQAEAEHYDAVKQMKKDVEAEAKELKKLIEETEEAK
mgnify:CR=1 FL=1